MAGGTPTAARDGRTPETAEAGVTSTEAAETADTVVLDYCAAVRGILNDDQGGPLPWGQHLQRG